MSDMPERIYLDSDCAEWEKDIDGELVLKDDGVVGVTRLMPGDVKYIRADLAAEEKRELVNLINEAHEILISQMLDEGYSDWVKKVDEALAKHKESTDAGD